MNNRGIYLVIYTGPGQDDNKRKPGYLWLSKGVCKFGQSLKMNGVSKRYNNHLGGNEKVYIAGIFKDRDDIDSIEKELHHRFEKYRLRNTKNNRPSEWMKPIPLSTLKKEFANVVKDHFSLF